MKLKQSLLTTTFALLLGITPLSALQQSGTQMPSPEGTDRSQKLIAAETLNHPGTIAALTIKLDESFRAISAARNTKGYITKSKAVLKAHEANIRALRNGLRDHTLFAGDDEYDCGTAGPQKEADAQCQEQMKRLVHEVAESFDTLEYTNDAPDNPNSTPTMDIGPAYLAHREALKKLAATIAQHEPAIAQAMKTCF